jgi:hypothetical protein
LSDKERFAGMFVGVHCGSLIAAGSANFPQKPVWQDNKKVGCELIAFLIKKVSFSYWSKRR